MHRFLSGVALAHLVIVGIPVSAETPWEAGTARVDVTPAEPVRLSGYGSRDRPNVGIDTSLYVRCLALRRRANDAPPLILITVDAIGVSGQVTREIAETIKSRHRVPRERIVLCATHTHSGPHIDGLLDNIFNVPLSPAEKSAAVRFRDRLINETLRCVDLAIADMAACELTYGTGTARFAANRRVLTDGKWTGFGVQTDGPVDHDVPTLRVAAADGTVRGIVFNYACHATTIKSVQNRINADWCGYACESLELKYPDAVAMCTIGCGADANPNPKGTAETAKLHGRTLATEVQRVISGQMKTIDQTVTPVFDYAALSFDLPTEEELRQLPANARTQAKRNAARLLRAYERDRRLPATYPVPIQSWRFGNQLKMVFIGGEVVVDYALRLKKRLADPGLWVTAYANDVMGYIASERMRAEQGYEYDRSGTYYGLPGPWAAGTEDLLIKRIESLLDRAPIAGPRSANAAAISTHAVD